MHIHPLLYQYTNQQKTVPVTGNTVGRCLRQLARKFPDLEKSLFDMHGKLSPYLNISVNQTIVTSNRIMDEEVGDGDDIYILAAIAGG